MRLSRLPGRYSERGSTGSMDTLYRLKTEHLAVEPSLRGLKTLLWPDPMSESVPEYARMRTYVLLDGARDERIVQKIHYYECAHECLFFGDIPEELAEVAPYLVELEPVGWFSSWLISEGWGDSWGIYVQSYADLETLRRHFRRYLRVKSPDGENLFFRYYDPRVLRVYLPTCDSRELEYVFGPVKNFIVESEEPGSVQTYTRV